MTFDQELVPCDELALSKGKVDLVLEATHLHNQPP